MQMERQHRGEAWQAETSSFQQEETVFMGDVLCFLRNS